jgi:hypothetical protein
MFIVMDLTAALNPFLWTIVGVLLIAAGGILAGIDPEVAEEYVGDRRLIVVTAAMAVVTLGALIAALPAIAASLGPH